MELDEQLNTKGVSFEVDSSARQWLIDNGYDEKMGARPMARLIQEQVKKPLADELLFGKLANGGHVALKLKEGKLYFDTQQQQEEGVF